MFLFDQFSVLTRTCFAYLFDVYSFCEHQVKMMILKVIARIIGLHRLILLNFYPFLQKYVQVYNSNLSVEVVILLVNRGMTVLAFAASSTWYHQFACSSSSGLSWYGTISFCLLFFWIWCEALLFVYLVIYSSNWVLTVLFYFLFLLSIILLTINQVPPDAVEPLFKQIVNQFVHDRSRTEV